MKTFYTLLNKLIEKKIEEETLKLTKQLLKSQEDFINEVTKEISNLTKTVKDHREQQNNLPMLSRESFIELQLSYEAKTLDEHVYGSNNSDSEEYEVTKCIRIRDISDVEKLGDKALIKLYTDEEYTVENLNYYEFLQAIGIHTSIIAPQKHRKRNVKK